MEGNFMKIKMTETKKFCINYKTVIFNEKEVYEVGKDVPHFEASQMLELGYAKEVKNKSEVKDKAKDEIKEKKALKAKENKMIKAKENK